MTFKNTKTKKSTTKKFRCVVKPAKAPVEEALAISEVKQIASNQIKVTFNKDASANTKDSYKIAATDGTKEIGVKTVTYADEGKSALITTYTNVENGVTYTVSCGELNGTFTASVGEVATVTISTVNAQQNVKTPIAFTLFDANGINVTPSVNVDSTCIVTLEGSYVTAEKEKASSASVTMGTIGDKVDVTITYNKGVTGSEVVTGKQTITCVAAAQTLGNAVFVSTKNINKKSECAKFYLGLSDKLVALKENGSKDDIYFCAKDSSGAVISYDKYDVESSNDDVATVTVTKDSGKYMQLTVNGNSVGSANLNISASKNGVATSYSIPVQVSKGTTAVKMVATATRPVMSNVKDDNYKGKIEAKLLDANGNEVPGNFTYTISRVVADDKPSIQLTDNEVIAAGATAGTYAVKVTGSENVDNSYAFEQNVQIQVRALPDAAYVATGSGIKVTYQVELSNTEIDENPSLEVGVDAVKKKNPDKTEARLYAVYNGLFAGYVNEDGTVSDEVCTETKDNCTVGQGYAINASNAGIRVAASSVLWNPSVAIKFGNQYYKSANISSGVVKLFDPKTNAESATVVSGDTVKAAYVTSLGAVSANKADLEVNSVDHGASVVCGDAASNGALQWTKVARTGSYTVEYYYYNANGKLVRTPISKSFAVKNSLTMPTVTVTSKKAPSFDEDKLRENMKATVDMNNNTSDYESIVNLSNGSDLADDDADQAKGLSADKLKITYKYAIVEDNFGDEVWQFYVPINTTFSYQ